MKSNSEIWTCTFSNEQYQGTCPITGCWANCQSSPGGCAYANYPIGKSELSISELAYVFHAEEEEIEDDIADARQLLTPLIYFSTQMNEVRSRRKPYCPACGVPNSSGLQCLNKERCQKRVVQYFGNIKDDPVVQAIGIEHHHEFWRLLVDNPDHRHELLNAIKLDEYEVKTIERLIKRI